MSTILTIVASAAPFLFGVWILFRLNLGVTERYRQVFLPLLALVLGVLGVIGVDNIFEQFRVFFSFIGRYIPSLAQVSQGALTILFNLSLLLAFAGIKVSYGWLIARTHDIYDKYISFFFDTFYTYDEEQELWFIQEKFVGVRKIFRALFLVTVILSLILFFLFLKNPQWEMFNNAFYPAYPVLFLGEVYYFLSGITKDEYRERITVEPDSAVKVFAYAKLEKSLKHFFKDRLLYSFSKGHSSTMSVPHQEFCEQLALSDDRSLKLTAAYCTALLDKNLVGDISRSGYAELNHDAALHIAKLLEGKSVMFASPFYTDYLPYVFLPMHSQLLRDGKVLVLHSDTVDDENQIENSYLYEYIRKGLSFVSGVEKMWTIGNLLDNANAIPDVAILPFTDLTNARLILDNSSYFEDVSFVMLIDPSSLLATYQVSLSILAELLAVGKHPTYCIFDKNGDGLVDSLSHALRTNLTEVSATTHSTGTNVGMMWQADGEFLQHRLFSDIAHYMGVGAELGFVALHDQISEVTWASRQAVPLIDQKWILGQYYAELMRYARLPQTQGELDSRFNFLPDLWSVPQSEAAFIIAEDEFNNLFEAYRQFSTRAINQSFVNIISPNYLLRDYMVNNADILLKDPKAIPALAPDFSKGERNTVFSILMMMMHNSTGLLAEADLVARLQYAGVQMKSTPLDVFQGMLIEHIEVTDTGEQPEDFITVETTSEYDSAQRKIIDKRYYGLREGAVSAEVFNGLLSVPLITEAPDGTEILLGSRLYGHVWQIYLPGQFVTLQGKYYEIVSIKEKTGVVMRRAADHFTRRRYYRQLRTYNLSDWECLEGPADVKTIGDLVLYKGVASIDVETLGYLDMEDYGVFDDTARRIELSNIPHRLYTRKAVLRLDLPGASEKVVNTLRVLISENMKTLFPQDYHYISVLSPVDHSLPDGLLDTCSFDASFVTTDATTPSLYFVEDSMTDVGLLSTIERSLMRILEMCWEYLDWHEQMLEGKEAEVEHYDVSEVPEFEPYDPNANKENIFTRFFKRVKGFFTRGKKKTENASGEQPIVSKEPVATPSDSSSVQSDISKDNDIPVDQYIEDPSQGYGDDISTLVKENTEVIEEESVEMATEDVEPEGDVEEIDVDNTESKEVFDEDVENETATDGKQNLSFESGENDE